MAKSTASYVCQSCGAVFNKWSGKCEACNGWNTISEEAAPREFTRTAGTKTSKLTFERMDGELLDNPRRSTGMDELDRVLGGGLVEGSAILIGGDPGIGKSTLLLQLVAYLSNQNASCIYVSGEESINQIRLRAGRLGLGKQETRLATTTNIKDILTSLDGPNKPDVVVIDSIQTMYLDSIESAPGTVSQVRACAHELVQFCKRRAICLILVGHVTKDGQIAGPRVLEHMVDTVLYFEGERGYQFRILRAVKNRFGGTDEIGIFEMAEGGLREVTNPSSLFLSPYGEGASGTSVFAGMEGSRPMLLEIQALVSAPQLSTPRRAVVGWDPARLAMILAVLDARCGVRLSDREVYLNVAGGFKITEPAADLAVAAAILSALADVPTPPKTVYFGEVGLSGEVRPVGRADTRVKESEKLGFQQAVLADGAHFASSQHLAIKGIKHLRELAESFLTP